MWVPICSVFLFCCVFLFGSFLFLLLMFFCVLFSVFYFSVSLFCWVSVFLILTVEKKNDTKAKSWVHMHTNSKRTELESPGCSSFEENILSNQTYLLDMFRSYMYMNPLVSYSYKLK